MIIRCFEFRVRNIYFIFVVIKFQHSLCSISLIPRYLLSTIYFALEQIKPPPDMYKLDEKERETMRFAFEKLASSAFTRENIFLRVGKTSMPVRFSFHLQSKFGFETFRAGYCKYFGKWELNKNIYIYINRQ